MTQPATDPLFDVSRETCLVTGASRGLGRQMALTLGRRGAAVGLAARTVEALEELAAEIRAAGGRAHPVALDVTDAAAIDAALDAVEAALGPIGVLVNNAGISREAPLLDSSDEDWNAVIDTNLTAPFLLARAVGRRMRDRGQGGSIINVASVLAYAVNNTLGSYSASKAGLIQLTRTLALEGARFGIRVNAIAPGYIETDINRDFFQTDAGQRLLRKAAMRRLGEASELDGALLLLASPASSFMTGSTIVVDGGYLTA